VAYLPTCVVASSRRLLWVKGGGPSRQQFPPMSALAPKADIVQVIPAANPLRTRPSRPRVSRRSRAS
jgi:hypothetical protein